MWIPKANQFFKPDKYGRLAFFRPIPPKGLYWRSKGLPNLYAAQPALIKLRCNLSEEESELVNSAMDNWRQQKVPITENLEPGLINRLKLRFSTRESNYYTIIVKAGSKDSPGTTLIATFKYQPYANSQFSYYEHIFY
ncbi:MAG: hypothetical protein GY750_08450 [Lentisphaerae bacterium]|nr:hypothetical protein [Lentisphaerota bacterium]MCP4101440.1 hypothetical protein [Lentisphaerota bacterium]